MSAKPIAAEYAKSGKAGCKGCQETIGKGEFRLGFVGKANFGATAWYHYDCIWTDHKNLKSIDDSEGAKSIVQGYNDLKETDQKKLDSDLPKFCTDAKEKSATSPEVKLPLVVDYAKSAKSSCKGCSKSIEKGALRLGFTGKANFGAIAWYHYDCVWKQTDNLRGIDTKASIESVVDGFSSLKDEDQKRLKSDLPKYAQEAVEKGPKSAILNVDYAKSAKSCCKECNKNIEKDKLRIGFIGKASFGVTSTAWNHFDCFSKVAKDQFKGIHATDSMKSLVDGFGDLKKEDQDRVEKAVKKYCETSGKRKAEDSEKQTTVKKAK